MNMPFGKFKGMPVAKLPRHYLQWLADKDPPIFGPLQVAVYKALGLPAPDQPKPETMEQILDRVTKEVFKRFSDRERTGDSGECEVR